MEFDGRHHRAAKALAKGSSGPEACKIAGVSPATLTRWKRAPEFQQLIDSYRDPMEEAAAKAGNPNHVDQYRDVAEYEEQLTLKLGTMLERLGGFLLRELESMDKGDEPAIHPREISKLLSNYCSGLATLQTGNDRKTGYSVVIAELEKIIAADS